MLSRLITLSRLTLIGEGPISDWHDYFIPLRGENNKTQYSQRAAIRMNRSHATQLRQRATCRRINTIIIHHPIRQMGTDMTNKLPLALPRRVHLHREHSPIIQT